MSDSICLVGRTNVGKSLLFNKLVQYKNSIVLNKHGVTRDVNEGKVLFEDKYLNIFDTAGISSSDEHFSKLAYDKTIEAINKSSVILVAIAFDGQQVVMKFVELLIKSILSFLNSFFD